MSSGRLENRFRQHLQGWLPEQPWLVALSGGGDSVALLQLLVRTGHQVQAAHLDHQIRADSGRDVEFCQALCGQLNVPFHHHKVDVVAQSRRSGLSVEAAGRAARYRFLAGFNLPTLTAHTKDDQAETVLMRSLEGCGLSGLGGISPVWKGWVFRPLLPFERAELRDYLEWLGVSWIEDPTNRSLLPRARLRHQLLPTLKEWNPRILDALSGLAQEARESTAYLVEQASGLLDQGESDRLPVAALKSLPKPICHHVFRLFLPLRLSRGHIEALMDLLEAPNGKRVVLPGKIQVRRHRDYLFREPLDERASSLPWSHSLPTRPGQYRCGEWILELRSAASVEPPEKYRVVVDRSRLEPNLLLRQRRPGDRLRPAGRGGSRTVKKLLQEARLAPQERDRIPLLCSGERPFWLVGYWLDEWACPGPGCLDLLEIRAETFPQE